MSAQFIKELREERLYHLIMARKYHAGKVPDSKSQTFWAAYHRGKAMQVARIIQRALSG